MIREFVQHGGIPIIVTQLTKVHSSFEESLVVSGDLCMSPSLPSSPFPLLLFIQFCIHPPPPPPTVTPIHPSIRGSVVLNLLTRCITYMNPLNSSNQIKLPFSRVKVEPSLFFIPPLPSPLFFLPSSCSFKGIIKIP